MRRITLRSLWGHKRRLVSTVVAIALGVAFMSGTSVFADTINKVFDDLFNTANEKIDTRVQGEVLFSSQEGGDQRARFDASVLDAVAEVDGVAAAAPMAATIGFGPTNRILDAEGDPVGATQGPPTLIETWVDDELLTPYALTEGSRGPEADDEIALNVAAAEEGEFEVGDRITVASQFGNAEYTLVGTFRFGDSDSAAGAVSAEFTLAEAQRLAGAEGQLDAIVIAAEEGISEDDLTARVAEVLPDGTEAITGTQAAEQDANSVQEGFAFFDQILKFFALIALVVGIFIIANTFQILVAQRTREMALLRAVGASRTQILGSVLLEAVVIGLIAAVLGILLGIALAAGITAALSAGGADLPAGGLAIGPNTVTTGIIVGVAVTVLAASAPAIRATRVPPVAALRDVAIERTKASKLRIAGGVVILVVATLGLSQAWGADGDTDVVPTVGLSALLLLPAAIMIGPALAGPSVRVIGAFLPRLKGTTGRLAMENAARSPRRTSATASALLIGVALIGFATAFAASAKASVESEVERGFTGDLVVQPSGGLFGGFSGFSPEVARAVEEVEGIDIVASFAAEEGRVTYPNGDTADTFIGGIDPDAYAAVGDPRMEEGSLEDLRPGGVLVDRQIADDNDLAPGSPVSITFPGGGVTQVEVTGISDDLTVLAPWTLNIEDFSAAVAETLDFQVFATVVEGRDVAEVQAAVERAIDPFPGIEVLDRDEWIGDLASQLTSIVYVIYGLLALSIIIAMIGVANTLSLSVHERTRELGLLRAVGMARAQIRSAIRWEAVIISLLGVAVGLAVGVVGSYAVIKALEGFGLKNFSLPVGGLAVSVVAFTIFGLLASVLAARRAARLDILQAIAHD